MNPIRDRVRAALGTALLLVTLAACTGEAGEPVVTEAGAYTVSAALEPDPPREKGNRMRIELTSEDRPVEGAEPALGWVMPAMGTMAEMRGQADIEELGGGVYVASFDLPMGGSWGLTLSITGAAGSATVEYKLTVGRKGLTAEGASGAAGAQARGLPQQHFSPPTLRALGDAFDAYETVRAALAEDRLAGVAPAAERLAVALQQAGGDREGLAGEVANVIEEARRIAGSLGRATSLAEARAAFGEASRMLMLLANCDPRLGDGWHVFSCPMTETFPKWMQPSAELANPYMGRAMSTCGEPAEWDVPPLATTEEARAHAEAAHAEGDVAYWACSMHTSVRSAESGTCPICSMDLVPVTEQEAATGVVRMDAGRRQEIGVRTEPVRRVPMRLAVRAVGKVVFDETRLADVTVKYAGYIGEIYADAPGKEVRRGRPLFTLYSPEVYAAQREYLTALASQRAAEGSSAPDRVDALVEAARQRLRLWDLSPEQIERLGASGEAAQYLPFSSPVSGHIVEKTVVAGSAVEPGTRLYRIADLSTVWVEAEVYESDLPLLAVGQAATVTLPYLPGRSFPARIAFVYPYLTGETRTGKVRVELPNPQRELKPEMYAEVAFEKELGERLAVPEEAILYAGDRRYVFLDLGEGRLRPQLVEVGQRTGELVEVVGGLSEGDLVVTSGNFLVAAEARLKVDLERWQ